MIVERKSSVHSLKYGTSVFKMSENVHAGLPDGDFFLIKGIIHNIYKDCTNNRNF